MKTKIALIALFILSVSIRWYYLPQHLFFGFEQGRDAMVSMNISRLQDFVLVGPKTDIDGIFHGAWYYYLMALPYGLSGGSPLVAAGFLVILTSIVPLVMFKLIESMTKSWWWGLAAGLMTALSYEYITYARWISNVTVPILLIPLVYACLWWFKQTKKQAWFIGALALAGFAAQFQIILCLEFGFVFLLLFVFKWLPRPTIKSWLIGAVIMAVWFAPMVIFNLRNEFISFKGAQAYMSVGSQSDSHTLTEVVTNYGKKMVRLVQSTFLPVHDWRVQALVGLISTAAVWLLSKKEQRPLALLFIVWSVMSLPVIVFARSLDLTQLYLGSGLGLIGLVTLTLAKLWQHRWGKVLAIGWLMLYVSGLPTLEYNLQTNQYVLFRTIQDDLNLADQQALLQYVHDDAAGQPYRMEAFTVPYFQPQAWKYLRRFWYPTDTEAGAQYVYIVIEEKVDPHWERQWTSELNVATENVEKKFGRIRVVKRKLL